MAARSLPSWNDGPARAAIIDFVARVTQLRGPDYVRLSERIAVFDNDGTLWCEHPLQTQIYFLADRLKQMVAQDPALGKCQPFKAFLEHDLQTLHELGKKGAMELFGSTHASMSEEEFDEIAQAWFAKARHPLLDRRFYELTYKPQIELLHYLNEHGFKVFIVSGGGVDFIRAFSERAYGVPREHVIGSSAHVRFETDGKNAFLLKTSELNSFNDREAKPQNIALHIGQRPILAFGNSDGDLAMLRYTASGPGPRLALLLHHDDKKREFAYDRGFKLSPLNEALDAAPSLGVHLVSMKDDWNTVFTPGRNMDALRPSTAHPH
jgi:phosphoserine phosphatase